MGASSPELAQENIQQPKESTCNAAQASSGELAPIVRPIVRPIIISPLS